LLSLFIFSFGAPVSSPASSRSCSSEDFEMELLIGFAMALGISLLIFRA